MKNNPAVNAQLSGEEKIIRLDDYHFKDEHNYTYCVVMFHCSSTQYNLTVSADIQLLLFVSQRHSISLKTLSVY